MKKNTLRPVIKTKVFQYYLGKGLLLWWYSSGTLLVNLALKIQLSLWQLTEAIFFLTGFRLFGHEPVIYEGFTSRFYFIIILWHMKASPREYVWTSLVICASSLESNCGSTPPDWNINRRLSISISAMQNIQYLLFKFKRKITKTQDVWRYFVGHWEAHLPRRNFFQFAGKLRKTTYILKLSKKCHAENSYIFCPEHFLFKIYLKSRGGHCYFFLNLPRVGPHFGLFPLLNYSPLIRCAVPLNAYQRKILENHTNSLT